MFNIAAGDRSAIPGGWGLTLDASADGSFGFLGRNTGSNNMTISTPDVAVFGNTDLWLANNDNSASRLRFYEANNTTGNFPNGTNYTSFEAGAQTADINYILPTATAATSTVEEGLLQLDAGTGQLSWVDPASIVSPAWLLTGNAGTTPGTNYLGTSDAQGVHIYVNGGADNSLILNTNGSIQRDTDGDGRGEYAVDLQSSRDSASQIASGQYATIGGGRRNTAINIAATVSGGDQNVAQGRYITVGGGFQNIAISSDGRNVAAMTIGGGYDNQATGVSATIAGGAHNTVSGPYGAIAGGNSNSVSSQESTIGGGASNSASGLRSVIGGGDRNSVESRWSVVPGGRGLTLGGDNSFGFLGGNRAGTVASRGNNRMTVSEEDIALFGNVDLLLANNNGAASRLRFYEANSAVDSFPTATTFYTSFEAGDQSEDINYILPTARPSANAQVLSSDTNGAMSWADPATLANAWDLSGNAGTTPGTNFVGTTDAQGLHLYVNSGTNNSLILNTNGSIQRGLAGDGRGGDAVDLQSSRSNAAQVASGQYATIGGGRRNTAIHLGATVAGGERNTAQGTYTTVGGGVQNVASASDGLITAAMTIGGGQENQVTGLVSTIAGGAQNTVSGFEGAIGGGTGNSISGQTNTIGGGVFNSVSGSRSVIGGGDRNSVESRWSVVPGGRGLTLGGDNSFGFLGGNTGGTLVSRGNRPMTVSEEDIALFGNVDLLLANNDGAASRLRFYEANSAVDSFPTATTFYTSFEAGDQSEDINYILPTARPSANAQVLSSDTNGAMSWADPVTLANAWDLSGNAGTTPGTNFVGTTDAQALHLYVEGGSSNSLILNTNGSIQRDSAGDNRGSNAVDLQRSRGNASQVASASHTVISGGQNNTASNTGAVVAGGSTNSVDARFSNIGGGTGNTITYINQGQIAAITIGGGRDNTARGSYSTIAGGTNHLITGNFGFIGGGNTNTVSGQHGVIGGGLLNTITAMGSVLVGGESNRVGGRWSSIVGGRGLTLSGESSFGFLGGNRQTGAGPGANPMTVTESDVALFGNVDLLLTNNNGEASKIRFYQANSDAGSFPTATTYYTSFEAGNQSEDINYILPTAGPVTNGQVLSSDTVGVMSWVGAGWSLTGNAGTTAGTNFLGTTDSTALHLYVNSGSNNSLILNPNGSIQRDTSGNGRGASAVDLQIRRGGEAQVASGDQAVIAGGGHNTAGGGYAAVSGGFSNSAIAYYAVVSGGYENTIERTGNASAIGGGEQNQIASILSVISGGAFNTIDAGAKASAIPGGAGLTLGGSGSFGFQGGNPSLSRKMEISEADVAVFGNVDLLLANNVGTASRLRFYEANGTAGAFPPATTFYTSFEAGDQSEDINYILPTARPSANGQVLSSDTNGVMSWADGGGTAWNLTGNAGTTPGANYIGTSDTTALHLYVNGGTINSLILNTNGSIQRDTAGNARGSRAVDLQNFRGTSTQVASGTESVIGGGRLNTASNAQAVVAGGWGNVASGSAATVSGGKWDTASGTSSTVGGGFTNVASGEFSTIAGGETNTASENRSTVSGGKSNVASGVTSTVGGGFVNAASGASSTIAGGANNTAAGNNATVGGGGGNSASLLSATVGGGSNNTASGINSTVSGGGVNTASAQYATVGGGNANTAQGGSSTIGGGITNLASGSNATVAGGTLSVASGNNSTVGGGNRDTASGNASTVSGGQNNHASQSFATIGGGQLNSASESHTTVGGGSTNTASGVQSTVAGGGLNVASGQYTTVGGGNRDTASGNNATVSGGSSNRALAENATVAGGANNKASAARSTVSGGYVNTASGIQSTVSGGEWNVASGENAVVGGGEADTASGDNATVSGGRMNRAFAESSTVGGGWNNIASGIRSTVSGGYLNTAAGDLSVIPGGSGLTLDSTADYSFGFQGGSSFRPMTISTPDVAVFANVDLWLANNDNAGASQIRFYEPNATTGPFPNGTNYTSFQARAQTADINYTLPAAPPTANGQVLSSTTSGQMSWVSFPTSEYSVSNASSTTPTLELANSATANDGTALKISDGRILLSNAIGAPTTLPDDISVYEVNDGTGSSTPTVALPAGGSAGQILYIYVSDPDGATVGGVGRATGDKLTYVYVAGGWKLFHLN